MRRYTKDDVEMHGDGWNNRNRRPAVNVKCYHFIDTYKIADHYGKDPDDADVERVMEWVFEAFQTSFWEDAQMYAEETFNGPRYGKIKIYSAGRSGGWLIVDGLPDFGSWDAADLAKWRKFELAMRRAIPTDNAEWLSEAIDLIDANEWLLTADDAAEREMESATAGLTQLA